MCLIILVRTILIFITANAPYFMYYLPVYLFGYVFSIEILLKSILNKKAQQVIKVKKGYNMKEKEEKILLFIPGYNCEKQIIRVLKQLDEKIMNYIDEIIFINNRSTDKTEDVALNFRHKNSNIPLKILRNEENYNLGGSHKVAFNYATKNKFDYIIVLHGDDQGDIHDLLPMLENGEYKKYDCLLGGRFLKNSKLIGYSKFRTFGNMVFNILFSFCTNRKISDLGAGLNMYNTKIFNNNFYHKFPDRLTFNCCMLFASSYYKQSIKFFPISWREDDQVSNVKMFSQAKITLKMALTYKFNHNSIKGEYRDKIIDKYIAKEIK